MSDHATEELPSATMEAANSETTQQQQPTAADSKGSTETTTAAPAVRTIETVETATMTDDAELPRQESESSATEQQQPGAVGGEVISSSSNDEASKEPVEAEEEPDTLSPLMTDNHTFLQHQELLREGPLAEAGDGEPAGDRRLAEDHLHRHHLHGEDDETHDYGIYDDDGRSHDEDDEEEDIEDEDEDEMFMPDDIDDGGRGVGPANMRHSDTKESISSIDSDVSLSYDRRSLTGETSMGAARPARHHRHHQVEDVGAGSSDDAAKDSGCEIAKQQSGDGGTLTADQDADEADGEEVAFETPDDETCEKIVEQVEFYFSNDNILKDAFLLKHVRRNKEGFVSLKLVSSFKRVRQLTKDWRVVGYAIKRSSAKIEVNDLGTKIRRLDALPEHDETTPSRTVVATGLPYDKYTVERVSELFSKCGEISLIRVLRPGGPIPADVRQFINKHPELQQNECALVEFTESASARRAQSLAEFVVLELVAPKKKTGKKATNVTKFVESYKFAAGHDIERSRGGEGFDRFRMRRGSGFYPKPDGMLMSTVYQPAPPPPHHHHHPHHHQMAGPLLMQQESSPPLQYMQHSPQPRKYSFGADTFECFQQQQHQPQRRTSAYSLGSDTAPAVAGRKFSNCSEGYSSCGEMSRRTSACSSEAPSSRRTSNCSEYCACTVPRRISQCSGNELMFRRISQCSADHPPAGIRKYSVGSNYDRKYTNSPELVQQQPATGPHLLQRRISMESNGGGFDRKYSSGSITGYHTDSPHISPRKYSNGFDPLRKLSSGSDQYYYGRKISTDSGYDRRISIGSECGSAPRSRTGSILCSQHGPTAATTTGSALPLMPGGAETVVRTPIGPDGSKGFGTRTRRIGHIVPPA
ncbi:uncharacterized protein LOC128266978 [Anopheles cruzii]|uniref:uncharacterized protein LOC128266978 n=1 Tax=Anopheles cruzii TaxID=68878 RepID=UPI0022EC64ED|nr:uncharacterized protein LOC128266978 [Anopheles cruzii]